MHQSLSSSRPVTVKPGDFVVTSHAIIMCKYGVNQYEWLSPGIVGIVVGIVDGTIDEDWYNEGTCAIVLVSHNQCLYVMDAGQISDIDTISEWKPYSAGSLRVYTKL